MPSRPRLSASGRAALTCSLSCWLSITPSAGRFLMASLISGIQPYQANQTIASAESRAITAWTSRSRPLEAEAKAAMPLGVKGCHALGRLGASSATGVLESGVWLFSGWTCAWNGFSPATLGARACLRGLLLVGRRHYENGKGITKLHDIVHEHFHEIAARSREFDIGKKCHRGGIHRRVFHSKLHLTLAQDSGLVWTCEPDTLRKLAQPGSPAIEDAQFKRSDRHL